MHIASVQEFLISNRPPSSGLQAFRRHCTSRYCVVMTATASTRSGRDGTKLMLLHTNMKTKINPKLHEALPPTTTAGQTPSHRSRLRLITSRCLDRAPSAQTSSTSVAGQEVPTPKQAFVCRCWCVVRRRHKRENS